MKPFISPKNIALAPVAFALVLMASSCNSRNEPDPGITTISFGEQPDNAFTQWLTDSIQKPYNIEYKYKADPAELDHNYMLTPPRLSHSMMLAKAFKYVWLEAYDKVADISFTQGNVPRIIMPVGSPAYEENGTFTLGTAEGGLKVTFYATNQFDQSSPETLNQYFFHTMHHEFGHILHSAKAYDVRYIEISKADYDQNTWQNRLESTAAELGFITPYAGHSYEEDFTELAANYITMSDEKFRERLEMAGANGADGRRKLEEKIAIMKDYMLTAWNIDMDELHRDVQNRTKQVGTMTLILDPWQELLRSAREAGTRATMPPLQPGINNLMDVERAARAFSLQPELLAGAPIAYAANQSQHAENIKNYVGDVYHRHCSLVLQLFNGDAYAKVKTAGASDHEH